MTTFSQLVDDMIAEVVRPDQLVAIASYVNQTVREMHFKPGTNAPIFYDANRSEDELDITTDGSWLWQLPTPMQFHDVEAIYLPVPGVYARKKNPRITKEESNEPFADIFWYRGGSTVSISGVRNGWKAEVSYFTFPRSLVYQAPADRIITYDPSTGGYTRKNGGTPSEAEMLAATNWMLERWDEIVKEGVRSKIWKRLADGDRARMYFSGFEAQRSSVWNAEPSS